MRMRMCVACHMPVGQLLAFGLAIWGSANLRTHITMLILGQSASISGSAARSAGQVPLLCTRIVVVSSNPLQILQREFGVSFIGVY